MRLKNKLGDRSNASSEVEYDDAHGVMIGPEGKGVATVIKMVQCTRLDCCIGSAGIMKHSLMHVRLTCCNAIASMTTACA
jgi:putative acyl-CoA dehydrogenase